METAVKKAFQGGITILSKINKKVATLYWIRALLRVHLTADTKISHTIMVYYNFLLFYVF